MLEDILPVWRYAQIVELGTHLSCVAIIMPDDVAAEKAMALQALGADIEKVRPASIVDKKQVGGFPIPLLFTASDSPHSSLL